MNTKDKKVHGDGTFIPGSVRVVDFNLANNNILVRGNSAFGAKNFNASPDFSDLTAAINNDPNAGFTGINYETINMVIDFCLIGFGSKKDKHIVTAELNWFTSTPPAIHGNSGPYPTYIPAESAVLNNSLMVYWPVLSLGNDTYPTSQGGSWNPVPTLSLGPASSSFDFIGLIPAIHNALTNQPSFLPGTPALTSIKNAIIYIHCDSGVNRTGAAIVSYLMSYGSSLKLFNLAPYGGPPASSPPAIALYTLVQAQTAANLAPPSNDSPDSPPNSYPGGSDIPVAEAYCNYIQTSATGGDLVAKCTPLYPLA